MPELFPDSPPEGSGFVLWRELRRPPFGSTPERPFAGRERLTVAFGAVGLALVLFSLLTIRHRCVPTAPAPRPRARVVSAVLSDARLRERVSDLIYEVQLAERVDFVTRFGPRVRELMSEVKAEGAGVDDSPEITRRRRASQRALYSSLVFLRRGVEERSAARREECYRKARLACQRAERESEVSSGIWL